MLRKPAVAGHFYQGSADALRREVERYILPGAARTRALGLVVPHAGLMYSGPVAGAVYSRVELPDGFILIGPNHTGLGAPVAIMTDGAWDTPLGRVEIDGQLASSILKNSSRIRDDSLAHLREHSLEVQLPFIQYFKSGFRIVPIQMMDVRLETCVDLGKAVAKAVKEKDQGSGGKGQETLIVASSDMTHYESARAAKEKDEKAIRHILGLDPEGLHRTVRDLGITMCGYGPVVAVLTACKELGATKVELVKYANSGEASGDYDQVVGYAGILIM